MPVTEADVETTIGDLPDDVLLHIMSFLDMDNLLAAVRAVCRRWRGLAVHRTLWKYGRFRCRLYSGAGSAGTARALRLAPRLDLVVAELGRTRVAMAELLCTTQCAFRKLILNVGDSRWARNLPLALRVLRHQAPSLRELKLDMGGCVEHADTRAWLALGLELGGSAQRAQQTNYCHRGVRRMLELDAGGVLQPAQPSHSLVWRALGLETGGSCADRYSHPRAWRALLQEALSMRSLERLRLSGVVGYDREERWLPLDVTLQGPAFLKGLTLKRGVGYWLTCSLLTAHWQTLTALRVEILPEGPRYELLQALAQCTQLRELRVPAVVYLPDTLSRLPNLTALELDMSLFPPGDSLSSQRRADWVAYFRSAVGLTLLEFQDRDVELCDDIWDDMCSWLLALTSSGRAALESLRLSCYIPDGYSPVSFEEALTGLPQLRDLYLGEWDTEFPWHLLVLCSEYSVPNLEWLSGSFTFDYRICPFPVSGLLARLPRLHFSGSCFRDDEHEDDDWLESSWVCGLLAPEHPPSPCSTCQRIAATETDRVHWHRLQDGEYL